MGSSLSSAPLPSERRFGLTVAVVLAALGGYGFLRGWEAMAVVALLAAAGALAGTALVAPRLLRPFNRLWFLFGEALGKIVSPIVLGVIFFGLLTPIALVSRRFGRDELRLRPRRTESYWLDRTQPDSTTSFRNQF
jgi:hypothetical protein